MSGLRYAARLLRVAAVTVLLAPVHLWRMTIVLRQPRCRYYPSCSTFALGAIRVHGPLRGAALAVGRVLRCHPWSAGGIDHVPPVRVEPPALPCPTAPVGSSANCSGARDA